ncbi:MAG: sulfite exporter TauE/SafE family protein [Chloroflexi bacterium]|nr:sulfite exporter TauE/SafE family protein [Chloroflexota bacterium]
MYSCPIAILGGLIGLGGAEFRLPVLAGPLRYPARRAVPLNLAVSLVTVLAALAVRSRTTSWAPIESLLPAVVALIIGAGITAFWGTSLARHISNARLESIILVVLVSIGIALILEGLLPFEAIGLLPDSRIVWIAAGVGFGLGIGLVSSLLGVAGGELIIPTLVFAFGADIKSAGTASLLVSLPTVIIGVARYARQGAFSQGTDVKGTIFPMAVGSVIGALIGGSIVGLAPQSFLKVGLGLILIVSAIRIFSHRGRRA